MKNILLLGSGSSSRQRLLREGGIPFEVVGHNADETTCDTSGSLQEIVQAIALEKMEQVCLPEKAEPGTAIFVLTADTLGRTNEGNLLGKPVDRADAIAKLKTSRGGGKCCTAFCLDKRVYKFDEWRVAKRIERFVVSEYCFDVPDEWIDTYLANSSAMKASGAITIEGFGSQFLQEVHGSYSTIVGLPMFELREALQEIEFF